MILGTSLLSVFVFSFVIGIGAVISPGPVSTTIVSQAPRGGWLVGPLVAAGHSLLELVIILAVGFGLVAGLAGSGVQIAVSVLGGLLLVWMGISLILGVVRGKLHLPTEQNSSAAMNTRQLVGLGMAATISNPFWYAWWVTVVPGYLAQVQALGLAAVGAFYLGHISADFAWDTALSAVVGGGKRWISDRVYRIILLICGAFFIYLGISFLLNGLAKV